MRNKKSFWVTVIAGALLLLLYCGIFRFSGQDGEASGNLSLSISRYGIELWDELTGGRMTQVMLEDLASYFEHPLRKAAHFLEYAVMGVLTYSVLYYPVKKSRKRYLLAVLWVFLSAALDELHQYFVPGRWASIADVLLDTCGGAAGALLCCGGICLLKKNRHKKRKKEYKNKSPY